MAESRSQHTGPLCGWRWLSWPLHWRSYTSVEHKPLTWTRVTKEGPGSEWGSLGWIWQSRQEAVGGNTYSPSLMFPSTWRTGLYNPVGFFLDAHVWDKEVDMYSLAPFFLGLSDQAGWPGRASGWGAVVVHGFCDWGVHSLLGSL